MPGTASEPTLTCPDLWILAYLRLWSSKKVKGSVVARSVVFVETNACTHLGSGAG
jgi:hypothetical protein